MANTLTGTGRTILGRDIDAMQAEMDKIHEARPAINPIKSFATSLSGVPKATTTVNLPYLSTATGSFSQNGSVTKTNADTTNIALGLNKDNGYFVQFTPAEVQQYDISKVAVDYVRNAIHGVDRTLLSASLAPLVAVGNFATASSFKGAYTSFSRSAVTNLIAEVAALNFNRNETVILLKSSYYWNLIDNLASLGNAAGAAAIQNGSPNNPFGVPIYEVQAWPAATLAPASGSIAGVICMKGATVLGTSIPEVSHATGDGGVVVSPETGVPMLYEAYYSDYDRAWIQGASVLWDAKKGVSGTALQIIDNS